MGTTLSAKRCPKCRKIYGFSYHSDDPADEYYLKKYGSPIKTCPKCQTVFLDKEYKEIAIEGFEYRRLGPLTYIIGGIGTWLGISICISGGVASGLIVSTISAGSVVYTVLWHRKRRKFLVGETIRSVERMRDPEYAAVLKEYGYSVPDKYLTYSEAPDITPSVKKIFDRMDCEYRNKVFYGDIASANEILTSLTRASFDSVTDENINLCFQIYLRTWIRSHGGFNAYYSTPSYIKEAVVNRFNEADPAIVLKCVDCSLAEIYRREPELKEQADFVECLSKEIQDNALKNSAIEGMYIDDPQYGLSPMKPVFVNGFGDDKAYLSHLYTEDGTKLSFERICSIDVKEIAGPVDEYRLLLPDNTEFAHIFICNYGTQTPEHAPRNMKYIK